MSRNVKLAVLAVLVVALFGTITMFGSGRLEAETQKKVTGVIGFVDVEEVFQSHPEKAKAEKTFNDEALTIQAQLEKEVKDKTQDQRQAIMQKYQEQLAKREQELISGVIASIDETIREVSDEAGIKVVLEKKNVIYGGEDLTAQVKERIQQKYENQ